jgi:chlorobactene glucosyltransferase
VISYLALFGLCALIVINLIALTNVLFFPRMRQCQPVMPDGEPLPLISVMIPARNEAAVIAETVRHVLAQDYPHFEVIVLDDNSDDGTGDLARAAGSGDAHLTIMTGKPLPDGWMGKNWACHQMVSAASGDLLLFTDADVRWMPGALKSLVAGIIRTDADLFTVWPTQQTESWAERIVVPLMAMVVVGYLPIIGTHHTPFAIFGAANGQCMAWQRRAYDRIGGHAAVANNVLEDVTLGRMVKQQGMRLRMADGAGLIVCRMYQDWRSVRNGYAKNILAGYFNSVPLLLLSAVFHWLILVLPYVWLAFGWLTPQIEGWPGLPLAMIGLGLSVRALTAAFTRQRVHDALTLPIAAMLMTIISVQSLWWHYRYGGPNWKGRFITQRSARSAERG